MLADMEIQCTAARALLYRCAEMIDKTGKYDTELGSITKTKPKMINGSWYPVLPGQICILPYSS